MPHLEHTNSVVLCAGCSTLSSTSAYCLTEKTHYRIMCSMLNYFFNLRSCLTENTQTLLHYVLGAELCLKHQLIASLRRHTIALCVRCSIISSTSDHASLRTHSVILFARCSTVASASTRTLQANQGVTHSLTPSVLGLYVGI